MHDVAADVAEHRFDFSICREYRDLGRREARRRGPVLGGEQIVAWVDNGCPQGDPADLPAPRQFAEGWQMGQPDQIIYMSQQPFTVPAEGVLPYLFFIVDPGWDTDRWIAATETRPGNRAVVHHVRVFVKPDGGASGYPLNREDWCSI